MEIFYILQPALIGSTLAAFYMTEICQNERSKERIKLNSIFLGICALLVSIKSFTIGFEGLLSGNYFVAWYLLIKLYLITLFISQFNQSRQMQRKDYLIFIGIMLLLNDIASPFFVLDKFGEFLAVVFQSPITDFISSVLNWIYELFREYRNLKI